MKKNYEVPEVNLVNLEISDILMGDEGGLDPSLSGEQGVEPW